MAILYASSLAPEHKMVWRKKEFQEAPEARGSESTGHNNFVRIGFVENTMDRIVFHLAIPIIYNIRVHNFKVLELQDTFVFKCLIKQIFKLQAYGFCKPLMFYFILYIKKQFGNNLCPKMVFNWSIQHQPPISLVHDRLLDALKFTMKLGPSANFTSHLGLALWLLGS